jgi:elongation factor P
MFETSDIRKGLKIRMDNYPWIVVDFQFVKPGKGNAFTRTKLKNLVTGQVVERTFKTGEKLDEADLEEHTSQFLYSDGETYTFMDTSSYEQFGVPLEVLSDNARWLTENLEVTLLFFNGKPITVDLPFHVILQVTESEPGVKGDTATGAMKSVKVSTGAAVTVPLFINQGDMIKIDTRTGEYIERVNVRK